MVQAGEPIKVSSALFIPELLKNLDAIMNQISNSSRG
jgi:hypothetical protein